MPIYNTYNQKQGNVPDLSWHEWWLNGRQPQLADNMYQPMEEVGQTPWDTWGTSTAWEEYNRQLDNARRYKEYYINPYSFDPINSQWSRINMWDLQDPDLRGITNAQDEYIMYNMLPEQTYSTGYVKNYGNNFIPIDSLKTHEVTHALFPFGPYAPQVQAVDKIMHDKYNEKWLNDPQYSEEYGGDAYVDDPNEITARLYSTRKEAGLDPSHIVGKSDLDDMRNSNNVSGYNKDELLNRYDDDTLLRLFNEVAQNNTDNNMINYAAYGGNLYAKGGSIHIDPKNRGKFNATKKRTGKTTEELTHSKNPLTRKRAIFAQNAKKWKHDDGGYLQDEEPKTKWWQDLLIGGVNLANNYLGRGNEYAEGGNLFLNNNNMKHKFADGGGPTDPPYIENQYTIPENVKYGDTSNYITNTHEFDSSGWEEKDGEKWVRSPERTILESGYIPEVQVRAPYKDSKDRYIGQVADYLAQQKSTGVNSNYERLLHIVKQAYQDPENLNEDGSFNQRGFAQMAQMQHFGPGSYYQMGESQLHRNQDNYDYMDRLKRYYPDSNAKDTYYWNLITKPEDWDKTFPEYFLDDRYVRKHDNGGTLNNNNMNGNYFATGGYPTDPPFVYNRATGEYDLPEVVVTPNRFSEGLEEMRDAQNQYNNYENTLQSLADYAPNMSALEAQKAQELYLLRRQALEEAIDRRYRDDINEAMRRYFIRKRACGGNLYAEGGEVDPAMMQGGGEVPPEAGGMPPEMMGAPTPQGGMPVPQEGTPMSEQGGMPVEAGMPPQEEYPEEEMPEEEEEGQDEWEEGFWEARDEALAEGKKTFEYDGKVYPTDLGARNIKKKSKKKKYGGSLKVPKEILPY